jgi:hypothetical protein
MFLKIRDFRSLRFVVIFQLAGVLPGCASLTVYCKIKAVRFFQTQGTSYVTTERDTPEDFNLQQNRCENPQISHEYF